MVSIRPALIVTRREMRDQLRDWRIVIPVVLLTLFFPFLMNFTARQVMGFVEQYGANLIAERFIPFLLMIVGFFPITVSLVIALESFAGETERHSIEPLLSSPLEDWQLYLGKLLASLIPPLMASYLGLLVYLIGVYQGVGWTPEPLFLLQVMLLNAVQALVMVSGAVVISTQTTSVRAANLLASFIIIPMALLIQAESIVMLWGSYQALWWIIFGQLMIASMLIRMGIAHFNREDLLGRDIDTLNFRFSWSTFKSGFTGNAHSLSQWYKREVATSLRKLALPITIMIILLVAGTLLGADQVRRLGLPLELLDIGGLDELDPSYLDDLREIGFFSAGGVSMIWLHNLRAIAIANVLGFITFGVLGVIVLMLPLMLIGFFTGAAAGVGISPWAFLAAFTFPHGILEIPAIVITGAVILRIGATFVTPSKDRSIGQAWLNALGDGMKVIVALVIPLFFGAAILEVFVTPQIALWLLRSG
jgi:uncharacterized membrane protein SpoIIM required for sporulation